MNTSEYNPNVFIKSPEDDSDFYEYPASDEEAIQHMGKESRPNELTSGLKDNQWVNEVEVKVEVPLSKRDREIQNKIKNNNIKKDRKTKEQRYAFTHSYND